MKNFCNSAVWYYITAKNAFQEFKQDATEMEAMTLENVAGL